MVDGIAFLVAVHVPDVAVAEVQMLLQLLHRFTAMLLLLMWGPRFAIVSLLLLMLLRFLPELMLL